MLEYRIAVIQNEVEMQHSGYVDAIYQEETWENKGYKFYRFSSVNISLLFNIGENYLLDFDCLIIGTNATSDSGVYQVLLDDVNKDILKQFIEKGKGLLICSQKKLNKVEKAENKTLRQTFFMPDDYEYQVISRPKPNDKKNEKGENSSDGKVELYIKDIEDRQQFLQTYPNPISNERIEEQCNNNGFQKHYYRDYIQIKQISKYCPILVDESRGEVRNLLMVANPKRRERIVISTMALDWAGHFELIDNILYYLLKGIPTVAIINSTKSSISELKGLIAVEAELNNISFKEYNSLADLKKGQLKDYHSIFVFMPEYDEKEVIGYWNELNSEKGTHTNNHSRKKRYKFLFYKKIEKNVMLGYLSNYGYLVCQKDDICNWLIKKYRDGFWGKSFWKTHDVLFNLHDIGESILPYLKGTFNKIEEHYINGSYDGVLAPTCGLLELESLVYHNEEYKKEVNDIKSKYDETKDWLINIYNEEIDPNKYKNASDYNKKFIIRSFAHSECYDELKEKCNISIHPLLSSSSNNSEIDLCLDIEVLLICRNDVKQSDKHTLDVEIRKRLYKLLEKQVSHNGKWGNNLGKTAKIVMFLQKTKSDIIELEDFTQNLKTEILNDISNAINKGIIALKSSYDKNEFNWEDNVITTANAINALFKNDSNDSLALQDLARQFSQETTIFDSYESLKLSLVTIDSLNKECGEEKELLAKEKRKNEEVININNKLELEKQKLHEQLSEKQKQMHFKYKMQWSTIVFLLLMCFCLWAYFKSEPCGTLAKYFYNTLMVSPVVIGVLITAIIKNPLDFFRYIKDLFKYNK